MDFRNYCVASAGRAVLEMMQFDWEPLSYEELDQRLDQAVEEIIEADLVAKVHGQPGPVIVQVSQPEDNFIHTPGQSQTQVTFLVSESPVATVAVGSRDKEPNEQPGDVAETSAAVKHVTELLQNSNSIHNRSRLAGRARLSLSHTVLLSLTLLSKRLSYRSVSSSFRLEKGNIHRIFFSFCARVNALEDQLIRWPTGQELEEDLLPFSRWLGPDKDLEQKGVPQVLGVLGHTRIPIRLPISKQDAAGSSPLDGRRLRKREVHPDAWLNLELVCDSRGRFIHCRISRGSEQVHGQDLAHRIQQSPDMLPPHTCLVASTGYPLTSQILTPFSPCRSTRERLYNKAVEAHLGRFQQAVMDLKERFQRLRYLDMGMYERARAVVLTTCILYNALLDTGEEVKGKVEKEAQEEDDEEERPEQEDEEGQRRREEVAKLLFSVLEAGTV